MTDHRRAQCALAASGCTRKNNGPTIFLNGRGMHYGKLVDMICDDPIQSPFEHGKRLINWQRLERLLSVEAELDLWTEMAPYKTWRRQFNMEVDKLCAVAELEVRI